MKIFQKIILFAVFASAFLTSCSSEQLSRLEPVPSAFGNVNNIVLIADEVVTESMVGDTFMYYFTSPYPILPQPEPIMNVQTYTPVQLGSKIERKQLRVYVILADMSDTTSMTSRMVAQDLGLENVSKALSEKGYSTKVIKDRWAKGQVLLYVIGSSKEKLLENIQTNFSGILERINQHDSNQVMATAFFKGNNKILEKEIFDSLGVKISLPADYVKAIYDKENKTYWLRYDVRDYVYNIMIHKEEYTDKKQFTRENLIQMRDKIGTLVATDAEKSRMVINATDLPLFVEGTSVNGNFALEAKGVWEIENDFMGGPFINYLVHNPNSNELVMVDGFVFAPGKKKREAVQVLENILKTTKF